MDTIHKLFLQAIATAIRGESVHWNQEISQEEWDVLLHMAADHQVLPLVFEAVYACPAFSSAGKDLTGPVRLSVQRQVIEQASRTIRFLKLYSSLKKAGADPLVVKGIVCRELYPVPDQRPSGDEDVLIPPSDYALCKEVFLRNGLVVADEQAEAENSFEIPFRKPGSSLHIELHKSLFPPESEAYGNLNSFFENVHSRAATVSVMGVPIRTLHPTDHLFYLICHAFKHFLYSGFGIRQVCDIMLFANAYGAEIQWDLVLENCRAIRADRFAAALFRIGEQYLSFDQNKSCITAQWQQIHVDPEPLLADLLSAGTYGKSSNGRLHSSTITLDAVAAQNHGRKKRGLTAALFPSADSLKGRYPYLKDHPWLLPAVWVSRILRYSVRQRSNDSDVSESLRIGNQRIDLMKEYGILD